MTFESVSKLIETSPHESLTDYIYLSNKLKQEISESNISWKKKLTIALLASSSINGVAETLFVKCCSIGVLADIRTGEYNQYAQAILDPKSWLYSVKQDIVVLAIDSLSILGDYYLTPYAISAEARRLLVEEKAKEMLALVKKIKEQGTAKIILHNFEVPSATVMGILESKQDFGLIEAIETLNASLREGLRYDSRVFLYDYNSFLSSIGKNSIIDYKIYYLGDFKLSMQYFPALCDDYISYIKPLASLSKKCLVLDLDNTLWGGIIGEDGIEGIKLGHTSAGRPYVEFQKYILSLFQRGVILAVNSRNNPEDALKVLREHPDMILREKHFASMQINWNDKASNLRAIAKELNIDTDSLVFVDDDKRMRAIVRQELPEVLTIDLPEDPALYLKTIMGVNDFNTLQITSEDALRGQIYAIQKERGALRQEVSDIDEYIKNLDIVVSIEKLGPFTLPRAAQLMEKTNQFNMTTKRYTEDNIRSFMEDNRYKCFVIGVKDRFGDQGHAGVVIIKEEGRRWIIDSFLLSCRVLGIKVEDAILDYLLREARKRSILEIVGEFTPNEKNIPAKNFYRDHSFKLSQKNARSVIYSYRLAEKEAVWAPSSIKVVVQAEKKR